MTWWRDRCVFDANHPDPKAGGYPLPPASGRRPLGPVVMMASRLLVRVTVGIGVYDPVNGGTAVHPGSRPASDSAVSRPCSGARIFEHRVRHPGGTGLIAPRRYAPRKRGQRLSALHLEERRASSRDSSRPCSLRPPAPTNPDALASAKRTVGWMAGANTGSVVSVGDVGEHFAVW